MSLLDTFRRIYCPEPTPFQASMRSFDQQIADARSKHKPTRHIEKERAAFTREALRG